jgi:hypothetical protein
VKYGTRTFITSQPKTFRYRKLAGTIVFFCVGFYQETRRNLQYRYNNNWTNIRTQVPVDRFQINSPEVQGVFPIEQIVRQGSLPVDFIRNNFCPSERDQRFYDHTPTYEEWLFKVEQIPRFYVVTYKIIETINWQDRAHHQVGIVLFLHLKGHLPVD